MSDTYQEPYGVLFNGENPMQIPVSPRAAGIIRRLAFLLDMMPGNVIEQLLLTTEYLDAVSGEALAFSDILRLFTYRTKADAEVIAARATAYFGKPFIVEDKEGVPGRYGVKLDFERTRGAE